MDTDTAFLISQLTITFEIANISFQVISSTVLLTWTSSKIWFFYYNRAGFSVVASISVKEMLASCDVFYR